MSLESQIATLLDVCAHEELFLGAAADGRLFPSHSPKNTPSSAVRSWIETGFCRPWKQALREEPTSVEAWVVSCAKG